MNKYYVDIGGQFKVSFEVEAETESEAGDKAIEMMDEGNLSTEVLDAYVWGEKKVEVSDEWVKARPKCDMSIRSIQARRYSRPVIIGWLGVWLSAFNETV